MFELFGGARVRADAGEDAEGISEPVSQSIQMMNAHDSQGDPALSLLPRHPVRDGAHFDGGEDGLSECLLSEEFAAGCDGLVKPHVLIDGQDNSGGRAAAHDFAGLSEGGGEGFLSEDGFGEAVAAEDFEDDVGLAVGWNGDIEDLHIRVGSNLLDTVADGRDVVPSRNGGG